MDFSEPGETAREYINPEQIAGQLIIVWPIQHVNPAPPTKFSRPDKVDDAISVDVVTLEIPDENGNPKVFRSQLWRQSRLIQSFRQRIGQGPLLGTISKGTATMGQPPWIFISLTHEAAAVELANQWAEKYGEFVPSEPREWMQLPQQPAQSNQQGSQYQGGQRPVGQQSGGTWGQQSTAHHEQGPQPSWSRP